MLRQDEIEELLHNTWGLELEQSIKVDIETRNVFHSNKKRPIERERPHLMPKAKSSIERKLILWHDGVLSHYNIMSPRRMGYYVCIHLLPAQTKKEC